MENETTLEQMADAAFGRMVAEKEARKAELLKSIPEWLNESGLDPLCDADLADVVDLTVKREGLVRRMAKAKPLSELWDSLSRQIVECEAKIAHIAPGLV